MTAIRFSIVITSCNQRDFIRAAVESALAQPHPSKEIIVVDDGSSDGSQAILESYADSVRLIKFATNRGAIEARNCGATLARGKYLVFLDGDDVLRPWALDVYERIVTERSPIIIAAQALWFRGQIPLQLDRETPLSVHYVQYDNFIEKDRPCGLSASTWVVDRQAFLKVGGWSPGIFHLDLVDLATKLGCSGRAILICAPTTVFYRIHAANSIHSVPPFLEMAHRIMLKEKSDQYPGGQHYRFKRRAWLGGIIFFWTKRALRAHLYKKAAKLALSGWRIVLAGVVLRTSACLLGRRPVESLELRPSRFAGNHQTLTASEPEHKLSMV